MSYFTNRPRAYSKPTKEETRELSQHLSKCSPNELRLIILSAANESTDAARLLTKVMKDANLIPASRLQPVQPDQPHVVEGLSSSNNGLPTPIDISDDSEMSGTENIQPEPQYWHQVHHKFFVSASEHIAYANSLQLPTVPFKRSNKRKTFADRDDNVPSFSASSPRSSSSTFTKKRKPSMTSTEPNSHPNKIHCINCGTWTSNSEFENLHSCIYHPGTFQYDGIKCSWSCCKNVAFKSRGCLITQHKGVDQDSWLFGANGANGLDGGQQDVDEMGKGDERISQYARLVSSKG